MTPNLITDFLGILFLGLVAALIAVVVLQRLGVIKKKPSRLPLLLTLGILATVVSCLAYLGGRVIYVFVVYGGDVRNAVNKEIVPQGTLLCEAAFASNSSPIGRSGPVGPVVPLFEASPEYKFNTSYDSPEHFEHVPYNNTTLVSKEVQALACVRVASGPASTYVGDGIGLTVSSTDWDVRLVRWPDGVIIERQYFQGEGPPESINTQYGWESRPPAKEFASWLEDLKK